MTLRRHAQASQLLGGHTGCDESLRAVVLVRHGEGRVAGLYLLPSEVDDKLQRIFRPMVLGQTAERPREPPEGPRLWITPEQS